MTAALSSMLTAQIEVLGDRVGPNGDDGPPGPKGPRGGTGPQGFQGAGSATVQPPNSGTEGHVVLVDRSTVNWHIEVQTKGIAVERSHSSDDDTHLPFQLFLPHPVPDGHSIRLMALRAPASYEIQINTGGPRRFLPENGQSITMFVNHETSPDVTMMLLYTTNGTWRHYP